MLRRYFGFLAAASVICVLLISSFAVVQANGGLVPGVCFVVEIDYVNTGTSVETVDAYVIRIDTKERTTKTFTFTLNPGESGVFRAVFLIPDPAIVYQFLEGSYYTNPNMQITGVFQEYLSIEDCTGHLIGDGRINDGENEKAAPVVAYCEDGSIGVYDIDEQSHGNLVFRVALDVVRIGLAQAEANGSPVTLKSGSDDVLYALPGGQLQLSGPEQFTGKPYNYIFAGDFCG